MVGGLRQLAGRGRVGVSRQRRGWNKAEASGQIRNLIEVFWQSGQERLPVRKLGKALMGTVWELLLLLIYVDQFFWIPGTEEYCFVLF